MSEWWTYRPEDFLLFEPHTYWRLFERQNAATWPLAIVTLLAGALIVWWLIRPRPWSGRAVAILLAAAWAHATWSFLWQYYAAINWAAVYVLPLFVAEALLLLGFGALRDGLQPAPGRRAARAAGAILVAYAVAVHPFITALAGRPLATAEVFGLAPDPTAMATLGVVIAAAPTVASWALMVIPLLWCVATWATLHTMGEAQAWIPLAAATFALALRLRRQG